MDLSKLNTTQRAVFDFYQAPHGEQAVLKSVPVGLLEYVRGVFREHDIPVRIRFRGPRRDGMRLTTLKRDARAFAVYPQ